MAAATGAPDESAQANQPSQAEQTERIMRLPSLPNPGSQRGPVAAAAANNALQAMHQLGAGAMNGTVDYPYPTTTAYPVPPLPPIPVPLGVKRYRPQQPKVVLPDLSPPIPPSSPLYGIEDADAAIAAHNKAYPQFVARYEFKASTLLVRIGGGGWIRVFLSGSDVLGVRFLPSRSTSIPPVHAMPPSGPSVQITELFNSLHMNIPQILFRIPALFALLYEPCHYCGRRLNDADGYPLGRIGWLANAPKPAAPHDAASDKEKEKAANGDAPADGEKGPEKEGEKAEVNGEKTDEKPDEPMADDEKKADDEKPDEKKGDEEGKKDDSKMDVDDRKEDGRWVCWHPSCLTR